MSIFEEIHNMLTCATTNELVDFWLNGAQLSQLRLQMLITDDALHFKLEKYIGPVPTHCAAVRRS